MDFLSISCIDLLARALAMAMADSKTFSSEALMGLTVANCFFLCLRMCNVLLTISFKSFLLLSDFLLMSAIWKKEQNN